MRALALQLNGWSAGFFDTALLTVVCELDSPLAAGKKRKSYVFRIGPPAIAAPQGIARTAQLFSQDLNRFLGEVHKTTLKRPRGSSEILKRFLTHGFGAVN